MKITYFVHGTTTDNLSNKATGWLPGALSDIGIQQSKDLPKLVKDTSFQLVYCSDLKRAVDSAQLSFGENFTIIQDNRLREANYGDFDGKDKSFKKDMRSFIDHQFPNGESYKDVEARIRAFLNEVKLMKVNHIAIVAHEAPQLALEVITKGKTWEDAITENWRDKKAWQPGWIYNV